MNQYTNNIGFKKMPTNTYTKERLFSFTNEQEITLYDDCGNIIDNSSTFYDEIRRDDNVYYRCVKNDCEICSNKSFRSFLETGAFCKTHIQENRMKKIEDDYFAKTGYKSPFSNPEVRIKIEDTNEIKYGFKHHMKNNTVRKNMSETINNKNENDPKRQPSINHKKEQTCINSLGVKHPSQSDIIKKQKENTNMINRGVTHPAKSPDVLDKMRNTYKERTGFDSVSSNPEVRRKAQDTMEIKFGVRFPMQNPELMHKAFTNSFRFKTFTFPSGRTTKYMGYEHFAILHLLNEEQLDEHDIDNENLHKFNYRKPNEDFDRFYTPDIYIKSQKRYVEVKSTYTITQDTENIVRKQNAIKNTGIKCEIWVINNYGIIVEKHY